VLEYLPLTFSRRHGDPSRPWNRFSIRVSADDGSELLYYEGNWRDIFQNWQALLRSYPRYLPHVVAKFLNASTVDGHNPYRISRDGIDWEVPDPDDPWSNIGYWGDHQIVYLLHLLEDWHGRARRPRGLARPTGVHLRRRAVPDRGPRGDAARPAGHDRVRRGAGGTRRRAGRAHRCGRAPGRRRRRAGPGHDDGEAARPRAGEAVELRRGRRDLDEHPAARVERREQRAGRLRPVDGHALPARAPPALPAAHPRHRREQPYGLSRRSRAGSTRSPGVGRRTTPRRP
jgi:hypothetical protein